MKPLDSSASLHIETKMGEAETYKLMMLKETGAIFKSVLFRIGILIILYISPALAKTFVPLLLS